MQKYEKVLVRLKSVVYECGALMRDSGIYIDSREKTSRRDIVTSLDLIIQKRIITALSDSFPEASFFAEEKKYETDLNGDLVFVIDPIDGTLNYARGMHYSCVSVACLHNGAPVVGVVYNPYSNEMFSAIRGKGAFRNADLISVSKEPFEHSLVIFGTSPYNLESLDDTLLRLKRIILKCSDLRRTGSAALDICRVAEGKAGLFFESSLSIWDYSAAALILTEAGGILCDYYGNPLQFNEEKTSVIAGPVNLIEQSGILIKCSNTENEDGTEELSRYLDCLKEHSFTYKDNDSLELVQERDTIVNYRRNHPGRPGIVYSSQYHSFVVDLVRTKDGSLHQCERLEKTNRGNSVVIIPVYDNKYILIRQFRHAMGDYQWCFPRGFGEPDISPEENAIKETKEEINCNVTRAVHLGVTVADSGICGEETHVYLCYIDKPSIKQHYENIVSLIEVTEQEIEKMIAEGQINDGYTLAAIILYKSHTE